MGDQDHEYSAGYRWITIKLPRFWVPTGASKQIKAVAIDTDGAYEREIRRHRPNIRIVVDLFYAVEKYGRGVMDHLRVDETDRVRDNKKAKRVFEGPRWLLLRNKRHSKRMTYGIRDDARFFLTTRAAFPGIP